MPARQKANHAVNPGMVIRDVGAEVGCLAFRQVHGTTFWLRILLPSATKSVTAICLRAMALFTRVFALAAAPMAASHDWIGPGLA